MLGDPAEAREFRPALRAGGIWLMLLGALISVGVGVLMIRHPRNSFDILVGVFCIVLCVLAVGNAVFRIARPRPIVFSPEGLDFPSPVGRRHIAWSNVRGSGIWSQGAQAINVLYLDDTAEIDRGGYAILRNVNRMLGAGDVWVSWADRDRGAEEFDELLGAWIRRYGGAAGATGPPTED